MSNIRVEVSGHTTLYMDVPELTMTGIVNSVSVVEVANFPGCMQALDGTHLRDLERT